MFTFQKWFHCSLQLVTSVKSSRLTLSLFLNESLGRSFRSTHDVWAVSSGLELFCSRCFFEGCNTSPPRMLTLPQYSESWSVSAETRERERAEGIVCCSNLIEGSINYSLFSSFGKLEQICLLYFCLFVAHRAFVRLLGWILTCVSLLENSFLRCMVCIKYVCLAF